MSGFGGGPKEVLVLKSKNHQHHQKRRWCIRILREDFGGDNEEEVDERLEDWDNDIVLSVLSISFYNYFA